MMKTRTWVLSVAAMTAITMANGPMSRAQAPAQEGQEGGRRGGEGRFRGAFGKITAIQGDSLEIAGQDGSKQTFKLTSSTEFRKERQPAKLSDFKVGDQVIVRANPDAATTAMMVAAVPAGFTGRGGGFGGGGGQMMMQGTLGKDYVVGEVKGIDPPKLTVTRTDNVTQTLELNEDTSLRRGRDSVTMADIQAGDHVFARGAVANGVFVPKEVNVISPEQWKRMQEFMSQGGEKREGGAQGTASPAPPPPAGQKTPPEQRN